MTLSEIPAESSLKDVLGSVGRMRERAYAAVKLLHAAEPSAEPVERLQDHDEVVLRALLRRLHTELGAELLGLALRVAADDLNLEPRRIVDAVQRLRAWDAKRREELWVDQEVPGAEDEAFKRACEGLNQARQLGLFRTLARKDSERLPPQLDLKAWRNAPTGDPRRSLERPFLDLRNGLLRLFGMIQLPFSEQIVPVDELRDSGAFVSDGVERAAAVGEGALVCFVRELGTDASRRLSGERLVERVEAILQAASRLVEEGRGDLASAAVRTLAANGLGSVVRACSSLPAWSRASRLLNDVCRLGAQGSTEPFALRTELHTDRLQALLHEDDGDGPIWLAFDRQARHALIRGPMADTGRRKATHEGQETNHGNVKLVVRVLRRTLSLFPGNPLAATWWEELLQLDSESVRTWVLQQKDFRFLEALAEEVDVSRVFSLPEVREHLLRLATEVPVDQLALAVRWLQDQRGAIVTQRLTRAGWNPSEAQALADALGLAWIGVDQGRFLDGEELSRSIRSRPEAFEGEGTPLPGARPVLIRPGAVARSDDHIVLRARVAWNLEGPDRSSLLKKLREY